MPGRGGKSRRGRLAAELDRACAVDPGLRRVIDRVGAPEPRSAPANFAGLARIINAQQLSTRAAATIWSRLERECRGEVTPRKVASRDADVLRSCGLSQRKVSYLKDLSGAVLSGRLDIQALRALPDDRLIDELMKIRGVGRWSAEIFAMFSLGRENIFPAGDLALRIAVQRYGGMRSRPGEDRVRRYARRWSPHRSAVALLMWKYYGAATLEE